MNIIFTTFQHFNISGSVPEYPAEARAAGGGAGRWPDPRVLPSGNILYLMYEQCVTELLSGSDQVPEQPEAAAGGLGGEGEGLAQHLPLPLAAGL